MTKDEREAMRDEDAGDHAFVLRHALVLRLLDYVDTLEAQLDVARSDAALWQGRYEGALMMKDIHSLEDIHPHQDPLDTSVQAPQSQLNE